MDRKAVGEEVLGLLRGLVAIPSTFPPGDTRQLAEFGRAFFANLGYEAELLGKRNEIANVVARMGKGQPSVVFNAHADTVDVGERAAWRTDPFTATLKDGRVYGLGACNSKSAMAVHMWLAREIARRGGPKKGEVVFSFVGDEENLGPDGLAFLREERAVRPTTLIVAAQTRNRLVLEERGVMWVKVTMRGKAAHAGAPHAGESAVLKMIRLITALQGELVSSIEKRKSESGQQSTLSIGKIRGGENTNVVPDLCAIEIDRRILPEEDFDGAFRELKAFCEGKGAAAVELLTGTAGFRAPEGGAGVRAFSEAITALTGKAPEPLNVVGASDGRYFARDGIEILVIGPGDGGDSHMPNEFVALDQLVDAAAIHLGAAERLLGI